MYESFFGLQEPPFALTVDPRFIWPSDTHQEGLSTLVYAVRERKGFALLTGEVGTGKTTLIHALLSQLDDATACAFVSNPRLKLLDFFRLLFEDFGIRERCHSKGEYLVALNRFLIRRAERDLTTLLIVDEAQEVSSQMLQEIRLLSNLETPRAKLLQILLVGQPELRRTLSRTGLRQLSQRIALEYHIEPLTADEVPSYLRHRIQVAGGDYESVFAPGVEPIFAEFTSGCPRLLNRLADRALLSAYAKQIRPVPASLVEKKAKEMALVRPEGLLEPEQES